MLVSGVWPRDSVIHIYSFSDSFAILLQNMEYSFLCYTVGPCWLSTLYTVVCINNSKIPNSSPSRPPPFPFGTNVFAFSACESMSVL